MKLTNKVFLFVAISFFSNYVFANESKVSNMNYFCEVKVNGDIVSMIALNTSDEQIWLIPESSEKPVNGDYGVELVDSFISMNQKLFNFSGVFEMEWGNDLYSVLMEAKLQYANNSYRGSLFATNKGQTNVSDIVCFKD